MGSELWLLEHVWEIRLQTDSGTGNMALRCCQNIESDIIMDGSKSFTHPVMWRTWLFVTCVVTVLGKQVRKMALLVFLGLTWLAYCVILL